MKTASAKILHENRAALAVAASAARMSTQEGTAMEVYARSGEEAKDLNLIRKVLASGHKSVIEHQTVSVAFNNVSVMVEQFVIEFRLASFTVKSRRYVDFSQAGYVVPEELFGLNRDEYCEHMEACFRAYGRLLEMGVPKEDARFVLPYSLRSNFFMTINARELIHMICSMLGERGAKYQEIRALGEQLKAQFDGLYPGVIDAECAAYARYAPERLPEAVKGGRAAEGHAVLVGVPSDAEALLETAMAFSGRFAALDGKYLCEKNIRALLNDSRPRELEMLNYTFRVNNISLACLTHFTRHRIQSALIPGLMQALCRGDYVLPESVRANPQAEEVYRQAFEKQADAAAMMLKRGVSPTIVVYYAMSGHVMDIMLTMNARELLHFGELRTCARAQWEIRAVAREMLSELCAVSPEIFSGFGPSCAVTGRCPEGRMSCGQPVRIENGVWSRKP